jgi:hypothetical protein
VFVALGSSAIDPQLAKRCITQGVLECGLGLRQYFLPVCDKQQASAAQSLSQARIVDSCHDRLARTRCRHQQISVMSSRSLHGDAFEQVLLKWLESQLNGRQHAHRLSGSPVVLSGEFTTKYVRIKVDEFVAVPAGLKQCRHALQDIAVAGG